MLVVIFGAARSARGGDPKGGHSSQAAAAPVQRGLYMESLEVRRLLTVTPPYLSIQETAAAVPAGTEYTVSLLASGPCADSVGNWQVNWDSQSSDSSRE